MLVLKDVLDLVQHLVLQGGRVPTRQVPYRQTMNLVYQVQLNKNASFAILLDEELR